MILTEKVLIKNMYVHAYTYMHLAIINVKTGHGFDKEFRVCGRILGEAREGTNDVVILYFQKQKDK